jgi:hypothetical protein
MAADRKNEIRPSDASFSKNLSRVKSSPGIKDTFYSNTLKVGAKGFSRVVSANLPKQPRKKIEFKISQEH